MSSWTPSIVDGEKRIRKVIRGLMPADKLFTFDLDESVDASALNKGTLLEQDLPFYLFEFIIEREGRAGVSKVSPLRYWGSLDLALFTKSPRDKIRYSAELESIADWFQDKTVEGIRFRTYLPQPVVTIHGFTTYNGVINFDFEVKKSME